jgi:hypothetical protein
MLPTHQHRPKYFQRFYETCSEFVHTHGAGFFKFDGIAGGFVTAGPPPEFAQDVFGLFELIRLLRLLKDDLFINLTVGTWYVPCTNSTITLSSLLHLAITVTYQLYPPYHHLHLTITAHAIVIHSAFLHSAPSILVFLLS